MDYEPSNLEERIQDKIAEMDKSMGRAEIDRIWPIIET
jgi:hypothetical protein